MRMALSEPMLTGHNRGWRGPPAKPKPGPPGTPVWPLWPVLFLSSGSVLGRGYKQLLAKEAG